MSKKGIPTSEKTKIKISLSHIANRGNRAKVQKKLRQYIENYAKYGFPSVSKAAIFCGMSEQNLYRLASDSSAKTKSNQKISQYIDIIKTLQKMYLEDKGLQGEVNVRIAEMILKSKHGYTEPNSNLQQQNNFFNVPPELLQEAIKGELPE